MEHIASTAKRRGSDLQVLCYHMVKMLVAAHAQKIAIQQSNGGVHSCYYGCHWTSAGFWCSTLQCQPMGNRGNPSPPERHQDHSPGDRNTRCQVRMTASTIPTCLHSKFCAPPILAFLMLCRRAAVATSYILQLDSGDTFLWDLGTCVLVFQALGQSSSCCSLT